MPLVSAKCTNCGASLEVDNTKDAAICPYCGTPYIVEKAVNYYNTTNNISAEVVNVYGGNSADFDIRAGELVKYNGAATDVVIPNSVSMIGGNAFSRCHGLLKVSIPDCVTSIGAGAFSECERLTEINLPDGITSIGYGAFSDCKRLTEINLPDGLSKIESYAFKHTGISRVVIPDSVKEIGSGAFYGCPNLKQVVLPLQKIEITTQDRDNDVYASFDLCPNLSEVINGDQYNSWYFYGTPYGTRRREDEMRASESKKGCYIATAVYGSYNCPEVWTLRRFRDNRLQKSSYGRLFIRCYYFVSPIIIRIFGRQKWFNRFWRKRLNNFVSKLQNAGYDSTPYID